MRSAGKDFDVKKRGRVAATLGVVLAVALVLSAGAGTAIAQQTGGSIFDEPQEGTPTPPPRPPEPGRTPPGQPGQPPSGGARPPGPPQLQPPSVPAPPGPEIRMAPVPPEQRADVGLLVESYEEPAFEKLRSVHRVTQVGDFTAFNPRTSNRWTGALQVPQDGVYHIRAETTGPFQLFVDGQPAIRCGPDSPDKDKQVQLSLAAGPHAVRAEYAPSENGTRRQVALWWASNGSWQRVPREAYRRHPIVSTVLGKKPADLGLPKPLAREALLPGAWGEHYDGREFETLMHVFRNTGAMEALTVGAPNNAPAPRASSKHLHAVLWAPRAGRYAFAVRATGAVELAVDGRVVLSHRGPEPLVSKPVEVDLTEAGHLVTLRGTDFQWSHDGTRNFLGMTLLWQEPQGGGLVNVPAAVLTAVPTPVAPGTARPPAVAGAPPGIAGNAPGVPPNVAPRGAPPGAPAGVPRPAVAVPRLAAPAEADVAAARKAVRTKYASYFAERKPAIQASLVKKLLEEARGASVQPAERYALLREAAEAAAGSGDLAAAASAVAEIAQRFQADETEVAVAVMSAALRGMTKDTAAQWSDRAMKLAEAAGDAGKYDLAGKAIAVADAAAKLMGPAGAAVAAAAKDRAAALRDLRAEEGKLKPVFEKLKATPADPDSNMRAGKFYCLVANDWARGLPALALAPQLELKVLAEMEQAALQDEQARKAPDAGTRQKLGDAWWDVAAKEREPYASKARLRAVHHYRRAIDTTKDPATRDRLWDRIASSRRPVDLLATVDIKRDATRGGAWGWRGRELAVQSRDQHGLGFSHTPAKEYDFLVEYSILSGDTYGYLRQTIPTSEGGSAAWVIDTRANHFMGSGSGGAPTPKVSSGGLTKGRHASLIRVRKDSVRVYLDGSLVLDWPTDTSALRGFGATGYPPGLGVACYRTTVVFHAAKLIEAPDEPAAPVAPAGGAGQ